MEAGELGSPFDAEPFGEPVPERGLLGVVGAFLRKAALALAERGDVLEDGQEWHPSDVVEVVDLPSGLSVVGSWGVVHGGLRVWCGGCGPMVRWGADISVGGLSAAGLP